MSTLSVSQLLTCPFPFERKNALYFHFRDCYGYTLYMLYGTHTKQQKQPSCWTLNHIQFFRALHRLDSYFYFTCFFYSRSVVAYTSSIHIRTFLFININITQRNKIMTKKNKHNNPFTMWMNNSHSLFSLFYGETFMKWKISRNVIHYCVRCMAVRLDTKQTYIRNFTYSRSEPTANKKQ